MAKSKNRVKRIKLNKVQPHPHLKTKQDPNFMKLFVGAYQGKIPLYHGFVPFRLIRPFDKSFIPQNIHPDGEGMVQVLREEIEMDQAPSVWVYPENGMFVLSDDYHAYEAFRAAQADYLPCFILGNPGAPEVINAHGPLTREEMKSMGMI